MKNCNLAQRLRTEFFEKTLDSLRSYVAVLNEDGTIISVNTSWTEFAATKGQAEQFCGTGVNYLQSCEEATGEGSAEANAIAAGIRDVVARRKEYFYLEYPSHLPFELRWFSVRITRFEFDSASFIVVTQDNITQRIWSELIIQQANCRLEQANRRLELQAATDGLTGIANRRSFESTLEREWKRHNRTQTPLSLAMLDVDCFKQYNDHYGHLAGDDCLKAVTQAVQLTLARPDDLLARYGGEEFAIILPSTDAAGAATVFKNILRSVRSLAISHPTSKVCRGIVTVSIGCATEIPSEFETPSDLLHRADQALYEAKAHGRDQLKSFEHQSSAVVCFES